MDRLEQEFLQGLHRVLGEPKPFIPLHEPEFTGNEWKLVKGIEFVAEPLSSISIATAKVVRTQTEEKTIEIQAVQGFPLPPAIITGSTLYNCKNPVLRCAIAC